MTKGKALKLSRLSHTVTPVSGFSSGLSTAPWLSPRAPTFPVRSDDFTIHKSSDEWLPLMQQAWVTGKAIQASITVVEQVSDGLLKQITYEFSNALIKSIQSVV